MSNNGLLRNTRVAGKPLVSPLYTNLSANKILAPSDMMKTIRIGITNGYGIWMPDARLLQGLNRQIIIKNTQATSINVYDNAGNYIATVAPYYQGVFWCTDISILSGKWSVNNLNLNTYSGTTSTLYNSGNANYLTISAFSETRVIAAFHTSASNAILGIIFSISDTTITVGTPFTFVAANASNGYTAITTVHPYIAVLIYTGASGYLYAAYVISYDLSAYLINNTTLIASPSGYSVVCNLDSNRVIVACRNSTSPYLNTVIVSVAYTVSPVDGTISNSSLSVGTVNQITISGNDYTHSSICKIDANNALLVTIRGTQGQGNSVLIGMILSVSGTTITVNPNYALDSTSPYAVYNSVCLLNSSKAIVFYRAYSNYAYAVVVSISGTVLTPNTIFTIDATSTDGHAIARLSDTTAIAAYTSNAAYASLLSVNGTNIEVKNKITLQASYYGSGMYRGITILNSTTVVYASSRTLDTFSYPAFANVIKSFNYAG